MTQLTAEERGAIIYGHTRGDSARAIAKRLWRSPSSLLELESVVKDAWSSIPPEEIQNLVASMPRRVKACIEAKGGHTKY